MRGKPCGRPNARPRMAGPDDPKSWWCAMDGSQDRFRLNHAHRRSRPMNTALPRLSLSHFIHPRHTMTKLGNAQDRAMELIGELGTGLRKAVPGKAMQWVETGAALGAMRTGTKIAGTFVRRNPVLAGAAIAGAGLLWLVARQRAKKQAAGEPIEGTATRVEAKRGNGSARARRQRASTTKNAE